MKPTEEILAKISKCLNLANGKNATDGEIAAAMAAAKKIANAHNIELASVDWKAGDKSKPGLEAEAKGVKFRSRKEQMYHKYIYYVLMDCYGLRILSSPYSLTFVGEKTDVAICQLIFPWLEDLFFQSHWKKLKLGLVRDNASDRRSVYLGFARGIIAVNLKTDKEESTGDQNKMAIVLRDKKTVIQNYIEQLFPDLKTRKDKSKSELNGHAYSLGMQEGKKINLSGLSAGKATGQLTG